MLDSLNGFVMKKNGIFSTSTQILESVYVLGHIYLRYVESKHQGHRIEFLDF